MPTDEAKDINFKNHNNRMRVPFVIYAAFECFTEPIDTCSPDASKSFNYKYQNTILLAFVIMKRYMNLK